LSTKNGGIHTTFSADGLIPAFCFDTVCQDDHQQRITGTGSFLAIFPHSFPHIGFPQLPDEIPGDERI
jgi:hypothetical protein